MSRIVQKIILLVDSSGSMRGNDIEIVKRSINKFSKTLYKYDGEHTRIDLQIISFADSAKFISRNAVKSIEAFGSTNLADAYDKLGLIFKRNGEFAFKPIIVLFCDGQPNFCNHNIALSKLYNNSSFRNSKRFAFAYGKQDFETLKVLTHFTGNSKNVISSSKIEAFKNLLEKIIPKMLNRCQYGPKNFKKSY